MRSFKGLVLKIQSKNKELEKNDKRKKKLVMLMDPNKLYSGGWWGYGS